MVLFALSTLPVPLPPCKGRVLCMVLYVASAVYITCAACFCLSAGLAKLPLLCHPCASLHIYSLGTQTNRDELILISVVLINCTCHHSVLLPAGPLTLSRHPTLPSALTINQLPITFICSEDLDTLLNESWLEPGSATASAPTPLLPPTASDAAGPSVATAQLPVAVAAATPTAAEVAAAGSSAAARLLAGAMSAGDLSIIGEEVEGLASLASVTSGALSSVLMGHAPSQDLTAAAAEPITAAVVAAVAADAAVATDDGGPDVLPARKARGRDQDGGSVTENTSGSKKTAPVSHSAFANGAGHTAAASDVGAADQDQGVVAARHGTSDIALPDNTTHPSDTRSDLQAVACPALVLLSQNDVCDTIAAVLKHVTGLGALDMAGLQLGDRVSGKAGRGNLAYAASPVQQYVCRVHHYLV